MWAYGRGNKSIYFLLLVKDLPHNADDFNHMWAFFISFSL